MDNKIGDIASQIIVFDSAETLSLFAARHILTTACHAVATRGRFLMALSGGGTPQKLFDLWAQPPFQQEMPWQQTHLFWGDERMVPPDVEGSNYFQAKKAFIDAVPIPSQNIWRMKGELAVAAALEDYRHILGRDRSRFDVVLMGMGADGHTASLFPHSPLAGEDEKVIEVSAEYDGRPAQRLTLTEHVFNTSRNLYFLVTGARKAPVLNAVINGPHDPIRLPAQRIRPTDGRLIWLIDEAAAQQLAE